MTAFQYNVHYVEPNQVRDDLIRVWCSNLPVNGHGPAKFDWTYQRAVDPSDGVFVLAAHNSENDAQIIGTAGLLARQFYTGDRPLRAAILADIAVDRPHRTVQPAIRLVHQVRRTALRDFDFAYSYPNKSTGEVFSRCGYRQLGTLTRYAVALHRDKCVGQVIDWPLFSRIARGGLDARQIGLQAPMTVRAARDYELEWLEDVDSRFDRLWQSTRRSYGLIGRRDAAFLRWRFLEHPEKGLRIAALAPRKNRRSLRAYAVIEQVDDAVCIRDLFGYPDNLGTLLDLLMLGLARTKTASLSMGFLGSEAIVELLQSRGFRARERERAIVYDTGASVNSLAPIIDDHRNWHLTDADQEW